MNVFLKDEYFKQFEHFLNVNKNKYINIDNYKDINVRFNYRIIINLVDNHIVACLVYWTLFEDLEIDYILVDKNHRRKKIAESMLNFLMINNKLIKNIRLEVAVNNFSALNLYLKNGFLKTRIRKAYYNNSVDAIEMIKEI